MGVSNNTNLRPQGLCFLLLALTLMWVAGCSTTSSQTTPNQAAPNQTSVTDTRPEPGQLLYRADFASRESVSDWVMEGPGEVSFEQGWMEMLSPDEQGHHVFWCPQDFPDHFIAQWDAQNLDLEAGLVIVFFAATGVDGQDIFSPKLPPRDGAFTQYTQGEITSYHISYYANAAHNPGRGYANLRKNNTFSLLQTGEVGIPTQSTRPHEVTLIKEGARIRLYVDDRKVIDYTDDTPVVGDVDTGRALDTGKIGFRQMKWTHFRYQNFRVRAIDQ
ncbi:DUF1961 family protein [Gilvimarinus sp. SDUM040013]|uniref:DUF1961 family protein n=1 Tax=Gilvimarinus gilvus TaxID=3058038 RepID=A0ABU4S0Q3_9GAMM|nr:DUF1961 family protein [Gilvimarinus sp. SDUM040013]MDO3386675.1 DUF1961 family protein [Gilvimarinus sp. SDUM040013]MDX6849438.1 DUF1961 family protein [Gilvimarinus sp. SDUM040013]